MDNLENIVNKMQSDAEMKYTRTVEKERAYCDGYKLKLRRPLGRLF